MLIGEIPFHVIAQVWEAIEDGHATFKIFTTNIRPTDRLPAVEQRRLVGKGHLSGVMKQAAKHGGMMFVHAEDDDIVQYMYNSNSRSPLTFLYDLCRKAVSEPNGIKLGIRH
jgi:dihydropyrimidinase